MNRTFTILIGLMAAGLRAETPPTPQPPATLRWQNNETAPGQILEASATDVKWKTPLFEDPLQLQWQALRRIDQPLAAIPVPDPFSITLLDGSHIYGNLVSVTETTVSIHSARHGDAVLKRSQVLSIRRIQGGDIVTAGPEGDSGWDIPGNRKRPEGTAKIPNIVVAGKTGTAQRSAPSSIPTLVSGPAGALSIPYWNRGAACDLVLPELVDVEFRVKSSTRPDFKFSLEGSPKQRLRIETWDDELVLAVADQFKSIRKIDEKERDVALRVCWDRKARKCSVFSVAGDLLTQWEFPDDPQSANSGMELQNKGRDLSLEFLRVRTWDGTPPPMVDESKPRIELSDGQILAGEVVTGSGDALSLRETGQDFEAEIPFASVDAVIFSTQSPQPPDSRTILTYADGTLVFGRILSIKEGSALIETSFTEEPLKSQISSLRQMRVNMPPPAGAPAPAPFGELDKLIVQQTTLHGKLVTAGDNWPRWMPVGGVAAATPSKALASEINRAFPADAKLPSAPALFYTSAGDVLPGSMRSIDRSGVEIESEFIETKKLPADSLDAIQLGAVPQMSLKGFDEPGWQVLKGNKETLQREKDTMKMNPETSIGHPSAMQSTEIKFSVTSTNFSATRLRMFCAGTDGSKSTNLLLGHTGNQFISGLEASEGQFENQVEMGVTSGEPIAVRLVVGEKQVELYVNGSLSQRFPIDPAKRAGAGLIIEPTGLWGNTVNPISLSGFSAVSAPGRTWLPDVSVEAKKQALMLPRFRKDDPPRHALLAANGDLLRGEIEAATATHFGMRSGLENLRVPVDRVKAVIWLKKPEPDVPAAGAPPANALKSLDQKIERRIRYNDTSLSTLINFLKREAPELKFKLPDPEDGRQFPMQFGGQTIGEALDKICSLYNLRYRVVDGTIVLEPAPKASKDLIQKVYWLKAGVFPNTSTAKEILTEKGVVFPNGTSVSWRLNGSQLSMTNSAANHEKLAEVLKADFGGILGSPTHWLLLTNGGRLGLVVDQFENGFILGHHPVYGRIKAPMSDIYSIRTSPPDASLVMKSVENWRLVSAPEPVLPETGGESSPTLGKEAKTFKLAMLGGGDFDLSQEKGKIIVLDFWATWCGPCVKSLPGLIEVMSAFPAERVKLIGVNQGEPAEQVKRFLETRGWKLAVAMDAQQSVAKQYGVDGIPHTVIVGPDGKVAWVKTGYSPEGETEAAEAVKKLLEPPADSPAKPVP